MDLLVAVRSGTMVRGLSGTNREAHAGRCPEIDNSCLISCLPACSHPLSTQENPGCHCHSPWTAYTRLLGFLISPWISILLHSDSPSIPFSIIFRPQPFRSVIVFRQLAVVQVVKVFSHSIRSSRRVDDNFERLISSFFRITCLRSYGETDHSVSKRASDGGYSYVLPFYGLCDS